MILLIFRHYLESLNSFPGEIWYLVMACQVQLADFKDLAIKVGETNSKKE